MQLPFRRLGRPGALGVDFLAATDDVRAGAQLVGLEFCPARLHLLVHGAGRLGHFLQFVQAQEEDVLGLRDEAPLSPTAAKLQQQLAEGWEHPRQLEVHGVPFSCVDLGVPQHPTEDRPDQVATYEVLLQSCLHRFRQFVALLDQACLLLMRALCLIGIEIASQKAEYWRGILAPGGIQDVQADLPVAVFAEKALQLVEEGPPFRRLFQICPHLALAVSPQQVADCGRVLGDLRQVPQGCVRLHGHVPRHPGDELAADLLRLLTEVPLQQQAQYLIGSLDQNDHQVVVVHQPAGGAEDQLPDVRHNLSVGSSLQGKGRHLRHFCLVAGHYTGQLIGEADHEAQQPGHHPHKGQ